MTQFARPSLDAAVDDGITLDTKFDGAMSALYTSHYGAAAPPSPEKGQVWLDTSGESDTPPTLVMKQYDGTTWRTLWSINKTTGVVTPPSLDLYLPLAGGTLIGNLTVNKASPSIVLDKLASGQGNIITGKISGANRWLIYLGGIQTDAAEAGSDFLVQRANDAGTFNNTPALAIERLTGKIGFGCQVTALASVDARCYQRCEGVDLARGYFLHNSQTTNDASVDMRFAVGTTTNIRARIRAQKEGSANNGKLVFGTYLGTTESDVLTLGSDKSAAFAGMVGVTTKVYATAPAGTNAEMGLSVIGKRSWSMYVDQSTGDWGVFDGGSSTTPLRVSTSGAMFSSGPVTISHVSGVDVTGTIDGGGYYYSDLVTGHAAWSESFKVQAHHQPSTTAQLRFWIGNSVLFGMRNDGTAYAPVAWQDGCDERVKADIVPITDALTKVAGIQGVTYRRTDLPPLYTSEQIAQWAVDHPTAAPLMNPLPQRQAGFLAQSVKAVLPEAITVGDAPPTCDPDGEGFNYLNSTAVLALAVQAIKELTTRNAALESRLAALEGTK